MEWPQLLWSPQSKATSQNLSKSSLSRTELRPREPEKKVRPREQTELGCLKAAPGASRQLIEVDKQLEQANGRRNKALDLSEPDLSIGCIQARTIEDRSEQATGKLAGSRPLEGLKSETMASLSERSWSFGRVEPGREFTGQVGEGGGGDKIFRPGWSAESVGGEQWRRRV